MTVPVSESEKNRNNMDCGNNPSSHDRGGPDKSHQISTAAALFPALDWKGYEDWCVETLVDLVRMKESGY